MAPTDLAGGPELAARIDKQVRDSIATGQANKAAAVTKPEAGEDDGDDPAEG